MLAICIKNFYCELIQEELLLITAPRGAIYLQIIYFDYIERVQGNQDRPKPVLMAL